MARSDTPSKRARQAAIAAVLLAAPSVAVAVRPNPPAPRPPPESLTITRRPIDLPTIDLTPLRHLRPVVGASSRDPFRASAASAARPVRQAPARPATTSIGAVLAAPLPAVTLVGIASSGGSGPTAIFTNGDELVFAAAGALAAGRFHVDRIGDDRVELTDIHSGAPLRMAIR